MCFPSSLHCDHVEGSVREGERETQERGDLGMCIRLADSLCYTAEANEPL